MIEYLVDHVVSGSGALVDLALLHQHSMLPVAAIQRLSDSRIALLAHAAPASTQQSERPVLTRREAEVLDGLRQRLTRREIADRQFRSENTVRSQVRSLYQKLGAGSLDEALETARRWGL